MSEILRFGKESEMVKALCHVDDQLGKLIGIIGEVTLPLQDHYFEALIRQMIGQQLSVKVARTIWERVQSLCPELTPENLFNIRDEDYRQVGVSGRKTAYIKGFSEKVIQGEIRLSDLPKLCDQEVIDRLVKVKGIGQWTAEMFLIFSLGRLNILSLADVGLQRAYRWLNNIDKNENIKTAADELGMAKSRWNPYNTVASLFLWEAVNEGYVDYYHSLDDLIKQEHGL